jgi:beta-galactosidase
VDLPHTWNAQDGQDSGGYYRADGWYRRRLPWQEEYAGKRLILEFLGANTQTDVYVNGQKAGSHRGGYTAFRVDITPYVTPGEAATIAVKVNNAYTPEVAPLVADFTFFGGLYRGVSLLALEPAGHVDMLDSGSKGLYLTAQNVSEQNADLTIKAGIVNDSAAAKTLTVTAQLRHPDPGSVDWIDEWLPREWLPFDPDDMTPGGQVAQVSETLTLAAGQSATFEKTIAVDHPRLWNGKTDPYRYQVELTVRNESGAVLDQVSDFVGFRYDEVDADRGFFLNGRSYPLRGVSRHQDRKDMGWAITEKEHAEDFAMIYELGANSIRLAHYPHADWFYELCDMYGIVVWAEIPLVDEIGGSGSYDQPNATRAAFFDTTRAQLTELIRQQYNRPSIVCWGLQNEIRRGSFEGVAQPLLQELNDLAHREDPTRFTTQAFYNATTSATKTWPSDAVAWNLYPGWYYSSAAGMGQDLDSRRAKDPTRPMGLSEYGYGANVTHHEENPAKPAVSTHAAIQSEEYQALAHEQAWAAIEARPWLWSAYVWNMFDFAVDGRDEAYEPGKNNKGLVTHDRQIKKDAFYFYKANWSDLPVVHLNARRFTERQQQTVNVKGYSNGSWAELVVNGVNLGRLTQDDLAQKTVFVWSGVTLQPGENVAVMRGEVDGVVYEDTVTWIFDGQPVEYDNLATGKPATASSYHQAENSPASLAVDGRADTRWTAQVAGTNNAAHYPEWITVDLRDVYALDEVQIDWFMDTRSYYYTVGVSEDGETFTTVVDRTANADAGSITDAMDGAKGRYLRITVTGNSDYPAKISALASIYEIRAYGAKSEDDPPVPEVMPGDVDQNGQVTAADALMALQTATGKIVLTAREQKAADVDGRPGVSASDALIILQYTTGKITAFN